MRCPYPRRSSRTRTNEPQNNANEGSYFVPQNITNEAQFKAFVQLDYPYLSADNLTAILKLYAVSGNITSSGPRI